MRKILSYKAVQLVIVLIITVILSVILTAVKDKEYSNWVSTEAVITDWKTGWHVSHMLAEGGCPRCVRATPIYM